MTREFLCRIDRHLKIEEITVDSLVPVISDFDLNPDNAPRPARPLRPAAVLVPLVDRNGELHVLLTRRADHLSSHAGQIAFPGGRADATDASLIDTALRETFEEVGIDRDFIEIVGTLDPYETGTGFSVLPVVGVLKPGFEVAVDPNEVAEAFEVPLAFLMDPDNHQRHEVEWQGRMRNYYAIPYKDYYIWGATAAMLVNFYRRLFETE